MHLGMVPRDLPKPQKMSSPLHVMQMMPRPLQMWVERVQQTGAHAVEEGQEGPQMEMGTAMIHHLAEHVFAKVVDSLVQLPVKIS